jgi:hydrophobic/amphiphilic exporter-1 (mainly G- bacteria), HAE1 family
MNIPKISIERPVFVSSILALILILGVVAYSSLGVDQFPDINSPVVSVITTYSGAGPEEIEDLLTRPIEEELSSLAGVKKITSNSIEGSSVVTVEFTLDTDADIAERHVRDRMDLVRSKLPDEVELPVIRKFDLSDMPIAILSYQSKLPAGQAYDVADQFLKPRLAQVPGVAVVEIYGGSKREIWAELDRDKLYAYRLTVGQVAARIAANGANTPIGKIHLGPQDLLLRSVGEYRDLDRLRQTVVNFAGSDVAVPLSSLGNVRDTNKEPVSRSFVNGNPSLFMVVFRQTKTNSVKVADGIRKMTGKLTQELQPQDPGGKVEMQYDTARGIKMSLADVKETLLLSILFTVLVVYLFLGSFRSTIITITALPVSLAGAFILMYLMGFTLNVISLLAVSLAVGLLVDDAIVVRENIWRHVEEGEEPIMAAEKGTLQVAMAVVATTSVVIAVFLPIGFLSGMVGQVFRQLGFTVCFAMGVSLFEAMTMCPMLSAYWVKKGGMHGVKKGGGKRGPLAMLLWAFELLQVWLVERYGRVVQWCLAKRWWVIGSALVVTILSLGLTPFIPKNFMPSSDMGEFTLKLKAKPGTSLDGMTDGLLKVDRQIRSHPEVENVAAFAGDQNGSSNTGQMYVRLVNYSKRKLTTSDFTETLRKELEPYKESLQPEIGSTNPAAGDAAPFNLVLEGPEFEKLVALAGQLIEKFKPVKGLTDLRMDYDGGMPEFQVKMDPARMRVLGVSAAQAGQELRDQVAGAMPAKLRQSGLEYDIRVRLPESQRNVQTEFSRVLVPNQNYNLVRLSDVAWPVTTQGPSKINRHNRARAVVISGQLAKGGAIGDITNDAKKILAGTSFPAGYRYSFEGSSENLQDLIRNIVIAMGVALVLIFLVLASLYESPVTPFTIMLAIPLAIVGALTALFLTHMTLDIFSMIGIVMLFGLVTKNSILLVDYTLQLRRQGHTRKEALVQAGKVRLRPILMTTIAITAGMLPIAMALSEAGMFRQSMGVAIVGGVLSSLFLTLLVVPAVYEIIDDVRLWFRKLFHFTPETSEEKTVAKEAPLGKYTPDFKEVRY